MDFLDPIEFVGKEQVRSSFSKLIASKKQTVI